MKRFRPRNNRGSMRRTLPANSRRPTSCRPSTCVSFRCMGSAFVKEEPEEALGEPVAMPAPPAPSVAPASAPRGAEPALIAAEEGVAAAAGSPQEEAVPLRWCLRRRSRRWRSTILFCRTSNQPC